MKELTKTELEANITHTEKSGISIKVGNKWKETYTKYAYFSPDSGRDDFNFYGYVVPLSSDKYGFSSSRNVRVRGKSNKIKISPEAQRLHDEMFANDEVPLNAALETIARCINDSMEYDVTVIESGNYSQEFKDKIKSSGYKPRGDETLKGVCVDAGKLIRQLLGQTLSDSMLRYTHVGSRTEISAHDTTLVFDIESGEWAVINSKSPLKQYNVVSKEKLPELGYPYSSVVVS